MRISQEEWNKRLEEVKLASEDCKTISEIVQITDYNRNSIKTLFKKFPEEEKMIKENLAKNKSNQNTTFKVEKSISKSKNDNDFSIVMLDTSVSNLDNIFEILEEYAQDGKILGITDVVLEKLEFLQSADNSTTRASTCDLLHIIKDNIPSFQLFEVKYNMREKETIHEAVINATLKLNGKALLLTSDKGMYIRAALKGVKVKLLLNTIAQEKKFVFDLDKGEEKSEEKGKEKKKKNIVTFIDAHEEEGKLFYKRKKRKTQIVKIFSRFGEEKQGDEIELEIGDHIFICTKRKDYISFLDYEVYHLKKDRFLKRYSTKSYNCDSIVNVENPEYKKFIEQARKTLIKE